MSAEVDNWVDLKGYPIDPEIREIVIILNLIGVPTAASCEGHIDHSLPYPWVDIKISTAETMELNDAINRNQELIKSEIDALKVKYPNPRDLAWSGKPEGDYLKRLLDEEYLLDKAREQIKLVCLDGLYEQGDFI